MYLYIHKLPRKPKAACQECWALVIVVLTRTVMQRELKELKKNDLRGDKTGQSKTPSRLYYNTYNKFVIKQECPLGIYEIKQRNCSDQGSATHHLDQPCPWFECPGNDSGTADNNQYMRPSFDRHYLILRKLGISIASPS